MARSARVNPPWLHSMLVRWGLRSLHLHGTGWYRISPMLRDGIPTGRLPTEPWDFGGEDYRQLEAAINAMPAGLRDAVTRAYKPWMAREIQSTTVIGPSAWSERLHQAAQMLVLHMRRSDGER